MHIIQGKETYGEKKKKMIVNGVTRLGGVDIAGVERFGVS